MRIPFERLAAFAVAAAFFLPTAASAQYVPQFGDLVKLTCPAGSSAPADHPCRAVYFFGKDGKRYVFPTEKTFKTWYPDGSSYTVHSIDYDRMVGMPLGGNVTHRPTVRMVKITTDPTVYVVSKGGILRAIPSEAVAAQIYGANWNTQIDDIPDPFFVNYKVGAPIAAAADYNKNRIGECSRSISVDKRLTPPDRLGCVDAVSGTGFSPEDITVPAGTVVTWIAMDNGLPEIATDPHPTHTDLPGLSSGTLQMGASYSYTFSTAGTWNYHNHNAPDQRGTVIVN